MTVAREQAIAVLADQKIYVMGGYGIEDSANWFEVFDIKTQTWRILPSPVAAHDELGGYILVTAVEGKLYVVAEEKDYSYDPEDGTWEVVREPSSAWIGVWCVIENVMYCCTCSRYFMWYDSKCREWKEINGLEELRKRRVSLGSVLGIVNYGGNIVAMWKPSFEEYNEKRKFNIWCAEIALEMRCGGEIWGKIEWVNTVFKVPKSYNCLSCLAISI